MANFKHRRCRYAGKHKQMTATSYRARMKLKPVRLPVELDCSTVDWGDRHRGRKYNWGYPRWHDILFHNRPRRAAEKRQERRVLLGMEDLENNNWPLSKKPHQYYW